MNRLQLRALDCKLSNEKSFWMKKLSGDVSVSGIQLDFKRPKSLSERNEAFDFTLDKSLSERLLKVSSGSEMLVFAVLLSALKVCLSKYAGSDDVVVGTTIHERFKELASINKVLLLRDSVKESATLMQVLLETKGALAQAYANQKYPFERILELLSVAPMPNRAPLFDIAITLDSINDAENLSHLKHDISLNFAVAGLEVKGTARYYRELFKAETIEMFIANYEEVLRAVVYHPDKRVADTGLSIACASNANDLIARAMETGEKEYLTSLPSIPRADRSKGLALSYAQQRLWFLHQLKPSSPAYNVASAVRLSGSLDADALERAFNRIIKRHEALRTTFATEAGKPVQVIQEARPFKLEVEDLSALATQERQQQARQRMRQEAQAAFDLRKGPVMRARVMKLGQSEHVLMMTMHHIVFDGWSRVVMVRELGRYYEQEVRGAAEQEQDLDLELEVQYADYAQWERERAQGEEVEQQMKYWRRQLRGEVERMELGKAGRGSEQRERQEQEEAGRERFEIGEELREQIREMSRKQEVSEYMVMLSGMAGLLYRYSGAREVVVGTPVANRVRREVEGMIGYFANTVVLRVRMEGEAGMREIVRRVKEVVEEANENQEAAFERVVEEMRPSSAFSHSPFFDVLISFEDEFPPIKRADLTMTLDETECHSIVHDLIIRITSKPDGLSGAIEYNCGLFDRAFIRQMIEHFKTLMREALTYPEISLIDIPLADYDTGAPLEMLRPIEVSDDVEQFDF